MYLGISEAFKGISVDFSVRSRSFQDVTRVFQGIEGVSAVFRGFQGVHWVFHGISEYSRGLLFLGVTSSLGQSMLLSIVFCEHFHRF